MVMFLLSFVKGVQIRGGESISASGYGPRGSNSRGVQIRWDTGTDTRNVNVSFALARNSKDINTNTLYAGLQ